MHLNWSTQHSLYDYMLVLGSWVGLIILIGHMFGTTKSHDQC
jgi:hypothetical protein